MQYIAFNLVHRDVVPETPAFLDRDNVVCVKVGFCFCGQTRGGVPRAFKMRERRLPRKEGLPGGYGKQLAVGAFYDKRRAVPIPLRALAFGRELSGAPFGIGTASAV